jgi:hypothetical protein
MATSDVSGIAEIVRRDQCRVFVPMEDVPPVARRVAAAARPLATGRDEQRGGEHSRIISRTTNAREHLGGIAKVHKIRFLSRITYQEIR